MTAAQLNTALGPIRSGEVIYVSACDVGNGGKGLATLQ